jgi:phosphatidylinositol glycan class C protein
MFGALPISQHLAVIALFLAVFEGMLDGGLGAGQVGWACVGLGLLGYIIRRWGWGLGGVSSTNRRKSASITTEDNWLDTANIIDDLLPPPTPLRPLILPPLLLALLSPVLGTLTSATTSDSIWPLAGGLFFVHLLLSDFSTGRDARLRRWQRQKRVAEQRRRRSSLSQYDAPVEEKR